VATWRKTSSSSEPELQYEKLGAIAFPAVLKQQSLEMARREGVCFEEESGPNESDCSRLRPEGKRMIQDPLGRDASAVVAPAEGRESGKLRSVPRYPFIADAEVVESRTKACLVARVSEIGLKGCYIDLLNPLPAGLSISVKIFKGNQTFEEEGQVVYTHPAMGMGVVFTRMNPDHKKVLEGWIQNLGK
jgi:PilZ domain